jgi:hypothetical protein
MSEIQNESNTEARQEIEKLRLENSQLMEQMLVYTGLCGQMHRQHARIEQLKSLLIRAADALENDPFETHFQIVQELRKAVPRLPAKPPQLPHRLQPWTGRPWEHTQRCS